MSFNISSSPHVRGGISTRSIMYDVCIALLPATAFGVYRFGLYSLLILAVSIGFAVLSEYMYQNLTGQKVLISDGSAILTGLLLGLNMPPSAPLWMPALGSMFAIVVVKQFFGGLGQNFMNPALGGRCFLLISFTGLMSDFAIDGLSSATPLAALKAGEQVDLAAMATGFTGGTIGEVSVIAILIGAAYLLYKRIISWEIPVFYIGSFALFILIFGGPGSGVLTLAHLCGGGLMLGAWFMATDYVTSPITKTGKILFGILLGILTGIFRLYGVSAEGVSYAIIISNLVVPLIEKITMPKAFGFGKEEEKAVSLTAYKPAINLCIITCVAGLALGAVYQITKGPIELAAQAAEAEAYASVCPQAESFEGAEDIMAHAAEITGDGSVTIDSAYHGLDGAGNVNGYIINVTTKEGFGGEISITVGVDTDGKVTGIEYLVINETAGLGMNATNESFYGQFIGAAADEFKVVKDGRSADSDIQAISGATITSNAVTGAINIAVKAVKSVL